MLNTMIRIRQYLTGQANKKKWPGWYVHIAVRKQIAQLLSTAAHELPDPDQRDKIINVTGRDPSYWLTTTPTAAAMTGEAKLILKAMQGRRRKEHRLKMTTCRRNREQARKERDYASWIKKLVGKERIPFDMDKLYMLDGSSECDSLKIHEILTEWFGKWFATDRDQADSLHDDRRWTEFLNDRDTFDELLACTAMEEWTKDVLWASLQETASRVSSSDRAELETKLSKPPSYADFVQSIIKPRGGPTAGLTGLTFNMMAEWPEEVMEAVYKALCLLHEEGHTPLHWKNKLLLPMPKAPNPSLEQLRPLMLIEVLRKVWCGFNVNTVWEFLEKNHVLEDIQFAYRRN